MATTLTTQNKETLKRLLKTGRWNNESEIMRYGLHLVAKEVETTQDPYLLPAMKPGTPAEVRKHIQERAGTWKHANGAKLLKKTRG